MALDFHNKENDEYLFGLDDKKYNSLIDIFEEFTHWTGLVIDLYGDLSINKSAQTALIRIIDKYVEQSNLNEDKSKTIEILGFRSLLIHYMEKDITFQLYGD